VGAAFLPDKRRQCPACKGRVPDDARKCMHCGQDLPIEPAPAPDAAPVPPVLQVAAGIWKDSVKCPACGWMNRADAEEAARGLKCEKCGVGFVPRPSKRK
jgi:DNA-directed RNA polymerase subunit RPC12/RpoP